MGVTAEDMAIIRTPIPTHERITLALAQPINVVYDVEITQDPDGNTAYAILIPGDMNWDDSFRTRIKRLHFVMGAWCVQNQAEVRLLIPNDVMINSMRAGVDYMIAITDDATLGRAHLYHPADSRYTYPYNIGCEIEDDREKNAKPSRWDGIKETLRRLFRARWTKTMILLGMTFVIIVLWMIGPILRSCMPGIVAGSVHTVQCSDGTTCESFLYLGADCITYSYDCCTGELKQQTGGPGGLPDVLPWVVGGAVGIGLLILAGYLLSRRRKREG
jgi:hypothetical protein